MNITTLEMLFVWSIILRAMMVTCKWMVMLRMEKLRLYWIALWRMPIENSLMLKQSKETAKEKYLVRLERSKVIIDKLNGWVIDNKDVSV